VNQVEV